MSSEKKKMLKVYIIMFPSHEFEIFGATLLSSRVLTCMCLGNNPKLIIEIFIFCAVFVLRILLD